MARSGCGTRTKYLPAGTLPTENEVDTLPVVKFARSRRLGDDPASISVPRRRRPAGRTTPREVTVNPLTLPASTPGGPGTPGAGGPTVMMTSLDAGPVPTALLPRTRTKNVPAGTASIVAVVATLPVEMVAEIGSARGGAQLDEVRGRRRPGARIPCRSGFERHRRCGPRQRQRRVGSRNRQVARRVRRSQHWVAASAIITASDSATTSPTNATAAAPTVGRVRVATRESAHLRVRIGDHDIDDAGRVRGRGRGQ